MNDPYNTGTPKYSTAVGIYDALCELVQTEEMSILSEMFEDISWEGQTYYYTDKGSDLKEAWDEIAEWNGEGIWKFELAIFQMDKNEIWDLLFEALQEPEMAKRLQMKKLFSEEILSAGTKEKYEEIIEQWEEEYRELNRYDSWSVYDSLSKVMEQNDANITRYHFDAFINALVRKVNGLRLEEERHIVSECRALLTSYDDFLYGLHATQHLYKSLEQQYSIKVAQLQAGYEQKIRQLLTFAEAQGIKIEAEDLKMLEEVTHDT